VSCLITEQIDEAEGASFVPYDFPNLMFFIVQVHESWLQRNIAGVLSQEEPEHVSPWSTYEHQLILQPSHPEPVAPWIRISIQIIKKPIRKAPLRKRLISFCNDSLALFAPSVCACDLGQDT